MMMKYRVHEVAKDLNIPSKDIIDLLGQFYDEPRKHMTALTEEELNLIFEHYSKDYAVESFDAYFAVAPEKPKTPEKVSPPVTEESKPKAAIQAAEEPNNAAAPKNNLAAEQPNQPQTATTPVQPAAQQPSNATANRPQQFNRPAQQPFNGAANRPQQQFNRPAQQPFNGAANRPQQQFNRPAQQSFNGAPNRPQQFNRPMQPGNRPVQNLNSPTQNQPKSGVPGQVQQRANAADRTVRLVDTRGSQVELEKYNEHYTELAPAQPKKNNNFQNKQKIKQRSQDRRPMAYAKRETDAEKLKRLALEKARKVQLKVSIPPEIAVGELAARLKITAAQVIKKLIGLGVMASISEMIDYDTAALIALEFGAKVEKEVVVTIEDRLIDITDDKEENLQPRSPVIVVMGHVDHGKTSLLDAIRHSDVVAGEAGGITQAIGAYRIKVQGRDITFLDTPGHEAFTSMRARGALATDIAVLVVAADDGIMPQTVEAINHAKAADVSIIVAINKIDKPGANVEKVKQQLTEHGLVTEEWGGDTICVPVSAKTHENLDKLLEMILLVADMKNLRANPDRAAKGIVIEARIDKGRGSIASVLVQNGTLHTGDVIIAGTTVGHIRAMTDEKGNNLEEAGPSVPVEITGLSEVPEAGDVFNVVTDERMARQLVDQRRHSEKEEQFGTFQKVTLDNLFEQMQQGEIKEFNVIVKADMQGSVEAVSQSLRKLSNEEVRLSVIHGGVGAINESDVRRADASNAIIIGFNVRPDPAARDNAAICGVEMRMYRIIYDCIEEIKSAMKGMLAPKFREVQYGRAEVRQVIKISAVGTISGCYVTEGKIVRNSQIRVVRDGIVITENKIDSLKRFKDDAKEVAQGFECGVGLEKFNDIKVGDIYESFNMEEYRED
jgi:translation initiation factor IF-2